jgi:virginiamycin A acetyltransferase
MRLSVDGKIAPKTYLNGNIDIGRGATVEQGTDLSGDVTLEENVKVGEKSKINGTVTVGRYSNLNGDNYVIGDVSIGQFCAIAPRTSFWANNHDTDDWALQNGFRIMHDMNYNIENSPIRIGSDVWCGFDAVVLPGVNVGHGACIGAHSVVTRDVEPYEIVAGNPAENIGWRFNEKKRDELLELEWWNWSITEIIEREDELLQRSHNSWKESTT